MHYIITDNFIGYFGSIIDNLYTKNQYDPHHFLNLIHKIEKQTNKKINALSFPKQIHTAEVIVIDHVKNIQKPLHLFYKKADALITKEKNIAIGVVTADCLPIFLYDPVNHAIGVIHAGWRGLATKIITTTILKMQNHFKTDPEKLQVYLGPSAGICCYEVKNDFLSHFPSIALNQKIIEERDNRYFFNPRKSAISELVEHQVVLHHIDDSRNTCTICHEAFCSVRRQKETAGRQPSVIILT